MAAWQQRVVAKSLWPLHLAHLTFTPPEGISLCDRLMPVVVSSQLEGQLYLG